MQIGRLRLRILPSIFVLLVIVCFLGGGGLQWITGVLVFVPVAAAVVLLLGIAKGALHVGELISLKVTRRHADWPRTSTWGRTAAMVLGWCAVSLGAFPLVLLSAVLLDYDAYIRWLWQLEDPLDREYGLFVGGCALLVIVGAMAIYLAGPGQTNRHQAPSAT
jgi:hypothetical protein